MHCRVDGDLSITALEKGLGVHHALASVTRALLERYRKCPDRIRRLINHATPAPNTYHQRVLKQLGFLLVEFIEKTHRLGEVFLAPTDVYFGETEVYQPDVIVVARDRLDIIGEAKIEGRPTS
ncbi:MAG: Uma2 family endonuclease [Gammaproteobacteria bacterium]